MDTAQPIQLRFLDEAEDCYDKIETVLLGLETQVPEAGPIDEALRAAHSVKGGAAMMGLTELSRVAHRLEDFFKILRLHHLAKPVETEVETLLLRGLDALRQVGDRYKQSPEMDADWLNQAIHPIFDQLQTHLGDFTDEDETALLAQDEGDTDPALVMFEDGADAVLERLEANLTTLAAPQLAIELVTTAEELKAFGHMANLEPFIELCQSIHDLAQQAPPAQTVELSQAAVKVWRRAYGLVLRRSFTKMPRQLEGFTLQPSPVLDFNPGDSLGDAIDAQPVDPADALNDALNAVELTGLSQPQETDTSAAFSAALDSMDLEALQADFGQLVLSSPSSVAEVAPSPAPVIEEPKADLFAAVGDLDEAMLADLQAAFTTETPVAEAAATDQPELLTLEQAAQAFLKVTTPVVAPSTPIAVDGGKTVRVPVAQLEQFNALFGKLILERNTVNLRLEQMQTLTTLMQQRLRQLEQSNTQLRQWYDQDSTQARVTTQAVEHQTPSSALIQQGMATSRTQAAGALDILEMDRYTDLHLIAQEQIETIVQLQEVDTDIHLTLQDMKQAVRDLNQTTRLLQTNINRTQMLPFREVVKRFPRVIRDLSVQYDKPVKLVIEGENTLIDRAVLEALTDPLNHLLRNAFDHGIGTRDRRLALGKPPEGTITIKARNRGTSTEILFMDDGAGIPLAKIRDRIQTMGLTAAEVGKMSEADLLDCIFEPGFSTASQVTELSGRGVGMDVVRTNLQQIRSDIKVDTQANVGTTFTITVPYALSILQVMLLEHAGLIFAVPVESIRELVQLQAAELAALQTSPTFTWQAQTIPVIDLTHHWHFQQTRPFSEMQRTPVINQPTLLVVGENHNIAGITIDRFWGEQEVTIRKISSPLALSPGFVSSTVLGDGRVVPIVDPITVVEWSQQQDPAPVTDTPTLNPLATQIQTRHTILVVDDSVNVRRFLADTLEKAGYQVEQAKDGQDAVDKLENGLDVQAVVCDIEMPRLDGYGVLEELKGQYRFEDLPIVMLTSRSHDKHRKLAMSLGASAYFSKPFNEQDLLQTLSEFIAVSA